MNRRVASGWEAAERVMRRLYFATVEPPLIAAKSGAGWSCSGSAIWPC
jgi:hypothetical protein